MDEIVNLMFLENLEHEENQQNIRIPRNPRSAFDNMSEEAFIKTFRLTKDLVNNLINILEPFIRPKRRPTDLDIRSKVSNKSIFTKSHFLNISFMLEWYLIIFLL